MVQWLRLLLDVPEDQSSVLVINIQVRQLRTNCNSSSAALDIPWLPGELHVYVSIHSHRQHRQTCIKITINI